MQHRTARLWVATSLLSIFGACAAALVGAAEDAAGAAATPAAASPGAMTTPLPFSDFLSIEARNALRERGELQGRLFAQTDLGSIGRVTEEIAKSTTEAWLRIYPADIEEQTIGGVTVYVVTPKAGVAPRNAHRMLIAAHQGGFIFGDRYSALVEAVPVAGRGRIKVLAVNYRKAPQFRFPAASEDMEAVYREALKTTHAANIGLYGCSAGGALIGETLARLQARGLPRPGAAAIMCSGLMKSFWYGGDAQALLPTFSGRPAPRGEPGAYFEGINLEDPLVTPGAYPEVLARFPPTLLLSGTRDVALSNVVMTHAALLEAGVDARLFVQEGMGHGHFFSFPGTRESAVAYDVIWKFFDAQLGR